MSWIKLFNTNGTFELMSKTLPTKGNLVYEYNPLRNYRLSKNMYEYKGNLYSLGELYDRFKIYPIITPNNAAIFRNTTLPVYTYSIGFGNPNSLLFAEWISEAFNKNRNAEIQNIYNLLEQHKDIFKWNDETTSPILHETGELIDFVTDELKISLDHPVQMIPQYSYDGSVNLIINDGITIPKLINTRFSATGKNTYEIVDRKGNNDSNIYDQGDKFESDISLYKRTQGIAQIEFNGVFPGGSLSIGNYYFYFKLADADGNESDFIGESGLVSVFIGQDSYSSVHTGQKNQNSFKQVSFTLKNIDSSYDYIIVYYSRSTAEESYNEITEYVKINKKFLILGKDFCNVLISGSENKTTVDITEINPIFNIVDASKTATVCQNRLFLANVHKYEIPYKELTDLSLRFLPYLKLESYDVNLNENYIILGNSKGYIDPKFIYEKTGYWEEELYRLGIVYILPNGLLSPVFNIRGACDITTYDKGNDGYTKYDLYNSDGTRYYITYDEINNFLIPDGNISGSFKYENNKGVILLKSNIPNDYVINSLDIRADYETIEELKKYVKGYFFVRQPRIPLLLALGITVGIDDTSRTPTLPIYGELLEDDIAQTYVETENLKDVNYVSEGFLTRFKFEYTKDEKMPISAKVALIALGVIALTAATIFTLGAAGVIGAGAAAAGGMAAAGAAALTGAGAATLGWTAVAAAGVTIVSYVEEGGRRLHNWNHAVKKYDGINSDIPPGFVIGELTDSRLLAEKDYFKRLIIEHKSVNKVQGIICPEYSVNQSYYNLIFTGNKHLIKSATYLNTHNCVTKELLDENNKVIAYEPTDDLHLAFTGRHYYVGKYETKNPLHRGTFKITGVPENTKAVCLSDLIFRSRAGEAEEAWRFEKVGKLYPDAAEEFNIEKNNSDIIRGIFSPYLAFDDELNLFKPSEIVNIYIPDYSENKLELYIKFRMDDVESYKSISDRFDLANLQQYQIEKTTGIAGDINTSNYLFNIYRGDCYLCLFTQRIIRNFNDPSAPYNDKIVDPNSWKNNYDPSATEKYNDINLGDVNAVPLGMWLTFKLRSSYNLNIRTLDGSDFNETAASGHERGFYPYYPMNVEGSYKIPESQVHNKGFTKYLSDRFNVMQPDVPYLKNWFGTRIMYSDVQINDAFKNGFRVFKGTNYRDYTREYGEIVKLITLSSNILVIFEHGISLLNINQHNVQNSLNYINTNNILPENLNIISNSVGSLWQDSILKTTNYVYGVDTVAKKIWRTNGSSILYISDAKVQEFLNNNITLGERELTPKLGIRNVKTVYNAYKHDVMFTFYDNTYGFEEKVWNLCWNELLERFITFYSWVPSFMENINNIPFSFNRDTSKWIAKLGTSHAQNSLADGITLSNVIINNNFENNDYILNNEVFVTYIDKENKERNVNCWLSDDLYMKRCIGVLSLDNRNLPNNELFYQIEYSLEHDNYKNYELFEILPLSLVYNSYNNVSRINISIQSPYYRSYCPSYYAINNQSLPDAKYTSGTTTIYGLFLKPHVTYDLLCSELYYRNKENHAYADDITNRLEIENLFTNKIKVLNSDVIKNNYPIFKDLTGKRLMLPKNQQLNPDKIVRLLNIKATINIIKESSNNLSDDYYNSKAGFAPGSTLIDAGTYESTVAVIPKWNMQFLSTDFWKHGQAGIIDIADDIYPTQWYGKQHPFEFECVVSGDPGIHKIFTNLELIANKAKPESFHYEIIGEVYDFAKDKKNMYFRQEAIKALWLYNGADISYNRNFLKIQPEQQIKSADFPHVYYNRQDTINEIEDNYVGITTPNYDYRHLSGSEIVYYPTRQEYRIWTHTRAVTLDELSTEDSRSIIAANCNYVEDKWRITINPILVYYKNEPEWKKDSSNKIKPTLPIMNSPIPDEITDTVIKLPETLSNYTQEDFDFDNWGNDNNIYNTSFGEAQNRREVDIKDKFIKIRVRYSGEELAIIDFLNTIYKISYA